MCRFKVEVGQPVGPLLLFLSTTTAKSSAGGRPWPQRLFSMSFTEKLSKAKRMLEAGVLNEDEFKELKLRMVMELRYQQSRCFVCHSRCDRTYHFFTSYSLYLNFTVTDQVNTSPSKSSQPQKQRTTSASDSLLKPASPAKKPKTGTQRVLPAGQTTLFQSNINIFKKDDKGNLFVGRCNLPARQPGLADHG